MPTESLGPLEDCGSRELFTEHRTTPRLSLEDGGSKNCSRNATPASLQHYSWGRGDMASTRKVKSVLEGTDAPGGRYKPLESLGGISRRSTLNIRGCGTEIVGQHEGVPVTTAP